MLRFGVGLLLGAVVMACGGDAATPAAVIEFPDAGPHDAVVGNDVGVADTLSPDSGGQPECDTDADCDDHDPTTADTCLPNFKCLHKGVPPVGCKKADDCPDDGNPCTAKVCNEGGVCGQNPIANCNYCTTDAMCDDGDACSVDTCTNHKCIHGSKKGCCTSDLGCDDSNACTTDHCTASGECVHETLAPCCTSNAQCDDGDACTTDSCTGGGCSHAAVPDCCGPSSGQELMHIAFVPNVVDGVQLQGPDQTYHWRESTAEAAGGPASLYFGDDSDGHYCGPDGNSAPYGIATVPAQSQPYPAGSVYIPPGSSAWATFFVWLDVRPALDVDTLDLYVTSTIAQPSLVWAKSALANGSAKAWVPVTVDLSPFAGQSIQLQFNFDVGDPGADGGCYDGGAGPRIDEVVVSVADCGTTIGCTSNAECNDGDPCTKDTCVVGQCSNVASGGCCTSDADCATGNPCLVGACDASTGQCVTQVSTGPGCCQSAADCVLGIGGICGGGGDCVNYTCVSAAAGGKTLMDFVFTDQVDGWSTSNQSNYRWREIDTNYTSASLALYFGNQQGSNYCSNNGGFGPPNGTAHLPGDPSDKYPTGTISFDQSGTTTLSFNVYLDVRKSADLDLVTVHLDDLQGNQSVLWTKANAAGYGQWLPVTIDVSGLAPFEGTLRIDFDAVDKNADGGCYEGGTGVYFDDIQMFESCK